MLNTFDGNIAIGTFEGSLVPTDKMNKLCWYHELHNTFDGNIAIGKLRKWAKIKNRYNQAPHLTQNTNGKVTTSQLDIKKREPRGQPFPSRWPQGINKQTFMKAKQNKTEIT